MRIPSLQYQSEQTGIQSCRLYLFSRLLLIKTRPACNELSFLANRPFTASLLSQRHNKHSLQHIRSHSTRLVPSRCPRNGAPAVAAELSCQPVAAHPLWHHSTLVTGHQQVRALALGSSHRLPCGVVISTPDSQDLSSFPRKIVCGLSAGKFCFIFASTLHLSFTRLLKYCEANIEIDFCESY